MLTVLIVLQTVIALLLTALILIQKRGAGLGSLAGGGGGGFQAERRGAEKLLHRLTIIMAVLFCGNAFLIPFVTNS